MNELIISNIISPIVVGFSAWILTVKKYKAEAKTSELTNVEHAIRIWRELSEELTKKLDDREKAIEGLKTQLQEISEQNKILLTKMTTMESDHKRLQKSYNELKNSISR